MMGFHSYLAWMYNEICIVADNLNTQDVEWKKEGIDGSRNATLYRTAYLNTIKSL